MNFLANNLKWLRKSRGLTQEAFAFKIGVKRSLVGAYEEGRAEPRLQTLLNICHYFEVSMDALLLRNLENGTATPADVKGERLRILPVVVDRQNQKELATLVPVKASAGYLKGYGDVDFIESLPKFALPYFELSENRSYRLFQIAGDSMLPVPSGAYIIGEYVPDWHHIKNEACYVLITRDEGVVYKRVINNLIDGHLILKSDNPEYEPYRLNVDQIMEVWQAKGFTSFHLPHPTPVTDVNAIASIIVQLKDDMDKVKAKLFENEH
jgi:transcriptional regulator with XRE-family HTH domain